MEKELTKPRRIFPDLILSFIPYKINLNGVGGVFKAHENTPIDPKLTIGTLILALPSAHQVRKVQNIAFQIKLATQGGQLEISHGMGKYVADFSYGDIVTWRYQ